jgi:hypothetical protein
MLDSLSQAKILQNCQIASQIYQFMEDQTVLSNDNCSYVTYKR